MLYITTPCSRPENLEIISKSIPKDCYWVVIYDDQVKIPNNLDNANLFKCPKTGFVGSEGRNYFLDNMQLQDNDWIYSLDDDNIIHPNFYETISTLLNEDYSIIHWGQNNKNNSVRLNPKLMLDRIDAACFITKWKHNKNVRYKIDKYNYDGVYAIECAKNGPILKLDKYICYYNYLK
jgi:hypothetical protein